MRLRCLTFLLVTSTLFCAGCGSPGYQITLRNGREFLTSSRPEFNQKTGYYKFRNLNKKDALIRSDEILMMNEL